jgi:hypothetical protein
LEHSQTMTDYGSLPTLDYDFISTFEEYGQADNWRHHRNQIPTPTPNQLRAMRLAEAAQIQRGSLPALCIASVNFLPHFGIIDDEDVAVAKQLRIALLNNATSIDSLTLDLHLSSGVMFVLQEFIVDVDWSRCRALEIRAPDTIIHGEDASLLSMIALALCRFSGLTSLDCSLSIFEIDDVQASRSIDNVLRLPRLQRLAWCNRSFSQATSQQFITSLRYATRLDSLSLALCHFEDEGDVARVIDSLNQSGSQLQQLDLASIVSRNGKRDPRAVTALAAALGSNTTLRDLSLGGWPESGDAHLLFRALSQHSLLTRLAFDKSWTVSGWDDQQIEALRAFVTSSPRLCILNVPGAYTSVYDVRRDEIVDSLFVIVANRSSAVRFEPDSLQVLYRDVIGRQHCIVVEICIGLQSLELPALVTLAIVDVLLEGERCTLTMHTKWTWIVAVKHFRDRGKR